MARIRLRGRTPRIGGLRSGARVRTPVPRAPRALGPGTKGGSLVHVPANPMGSGRVRSGRPIKVGVQKRTTAHMAGFKQGYVRRGAGPYRVPVRYGATPDSFARGFKSGAIVDAYAPATFATGVIVGTPAAIAIGMHRHNKRVLTAREREQRRQAAQRPRKRPVTRRG